MRSIAKTKLFIGESWILDVRFSGDAQFYPSADTLIQGAHYPTETAMDKLAANVKEQ